MHKRCPCASMVRMNGADLTRKWYVSISAATSTSSPTESEIIVVHTIGRPAEPAKRTAASWGRLVSGCQAWLAMAQQEFGLLGWWALSMMLAPSFVVACSWDSSRDLYSVNFARWSLFDRSIAAHRLGTRHAPQLDLSGHVVERLRTP